MKMVKFSIREEIWLASSPASPPVGMMTCVLSSGVKLVAQPPVVLSLVKSSLVMPISTLEASPENISIDLFCAFQPNLVMVPSLPLVLKRPVIPAALLTLLRAARLFFRMVSDAFSTKPSPKVGMGMRKMMLPFWSWVAKSGCFRAQPAGASVRPVMVNRSCTPPSGVPSEFLTKRTSSAGAFGVRKVGIVLLALSRLAMPLWGFGVGLLPPTTGCEWQRKQLLPLNR